jgi:hypothetical protein
MRNVELLASALIMTTITRQFLLENKENSIESQYFIHITVISQFGIALMMIFTISPVTVVGFTRWRKRH